MCHYMDPFMGLFECPAQQPASSPRALEVPLRQFHSVLLVTQVSPVQSEKSPQRHEYQEVRTWGLLRGEPPHPLSACGAEILEICCVIGPWGPPRARLEQDFPGQGSVYSWRALQGWLGPRPSSASPGTFPPDQCYAASGSTSGPVSSVEVLAGRGPGSRWASLHPLSHATAALTCHRA